MSCYVSHKSFVIRLLETRYHVVRLFQTFYSEEALPVCNMSKRRNTIVLAGNPFTVYLRNYCYISKAWNVF